MNPVTPSRYQFARNPFMNRWWIRNFLFGLVIATPVGLFGLATKLWRAGDLATIMGVVLLTCMVLLPVYSAVLREIPQQRT